MTILKTAKKASKNKTISLEKYDVVEKIVETEIENANAYYIILFRLIGKLYHKKSLGKICHPLIEHLGQSVSSAWISSVAKIFDTKSGAYSLLYLVELTRALPEIQFEYRLERLPTLFAKKANESRVKFKSEYGDIERFIRSDKVQERISELRNIFRQHNYPDRKPKHKTSYNDVDVLVERACEIYVLCLHASAKRLAALAVNADDYKISPKLKNVDLGILQLLESIA